MSKAQGPETYKNLPDGSTVTLHSGGVVTATKIDGEWVVTNIDTNLHIGQKLTPRWLWRKFALIGGKSE